ncbi:quinoprotein dehydrogenase-associated SoxYZ-like carrier [Marinobacterium sp. AK62]|uniref:Quinoprotein dehydrogenase-associated SoxYZ-like carrier n=1 Tax=Marinobacterium alkalitolerans TaxID=1542925 RepID=A0ABS3ZCH9_9GAMM|nr:quinoprotein dehydrogenase-associated SoxYZ-like carrier [Marinobacterium alkalitolerans]MBP0048719.1 quinoprotein dehydrogenase-associated SoxYZ-like carrier [Marinobacterium alkalitolerans]
MRMQFGLAVGVMALLLTTSTLSAAQPQDPLDSVMWDYTREMFLGDEPYQFDASIEVSVPAFAEDPTQVPVTIDAGVHAGNIDKVVVWADLNPIQHIFNFYPGEGANPRVSLRIKVQQSTAIRAAVKTRDGHWHVGYAQLEAAGGGCTTPSMGNADPYWQSHLGEIQSRRFPSVSGQDTRFKFKVIHPMDTGLVDAIPEFYLEQVEVRGAEGEPVVRMELSPPVSENPVFTFDLEGDQRQYRLWMRDNGGNEFEQAL